MVGGFQPYQGDTFTDLVDMYMSEKPLLVSEYGMRRSRICYQWHVLVPVAWCAAKQVLDATFGTVHCVMVTWSQTDLAVQGETRLGMQQTHEFPWTDASPEGTHCTSLSLAWVLRGSICATRVPRTTLMAGSPGMGWLLPPPKMPPKESKPLGPRRV